MITEESDIEVIGSWMLEMLINSPWNSGRSLSLSVNFDCNAGTVDYFDLAGIFLVEHTCTFSASFPAKRFVSSDVFGPTSTVRTSEAGGMIVSL